MIKTIHIDTEVDKNKGVDAKKLAADIEKESNDLIKEGYNILSVTPVTSTTVVSNFRAEYTSSVIITAVKAN